MRYPTTAVPPAGQVWMMATATMDKSVLLPPIVSCWVEVPAAIFNLSAVPILPLTKLARCTPEVAVQLVALLPTPVAVSKLVVPVVVIPVDVMGFVAVTELVDCDP
jgi:hypothetical protein